MESLAIELDEIEKRIDPVGHLRRLRDDRFQVSMPVDGIVHHTVVGMSQALADGMVDDPVDRHRYLKSIVAKATKMADLVKRPRA